MPGVLPILFFLVPLLVLVGIVAVIVASARHGVPEADQGIGTVRRIFVYVLSLAGLATSGIGMVLLVRFLLDSVFGRAALAVEQSTLALGIALAVVGTPVWLGFWWMAHQAVRTHPVERRALARKVYLYVVLGGAALTSAGGAISFLQWALGTGDFSGTPPALVLVWGALWAYHWRLEDQEGELTDVTITIRRLYIYLLALFGLALLATGAGSVLRLALDGAYPFAQSVEPAETDASEQAALAAVAARPPPGPGQTRPAPMRVPRRPRSRTAAEPGGPRTPGPRWAWRCRP